MFRGEVRPPEVVLKSVKTDVKLRMEADFARLPSTAFGKRWCAPLVRMRDGVPHIKL